MGCFPFLRLAPYVAPYEFSFVLSSAMSEVFSKLLSEGGTMGNYLIPKKNYEEIEVVGENFHTDNIASLGLITHKKFEQGQAVKTTFDIVPEPDNPYSSSGMALSVRKDNKLLGYLPENTDQNIRKAIARITASGHVAVVEGSLWTLKARDGLKAAIRLYVPRTLSDKKLDESTLELVPVADSYTVPNAYLARPENGKAIKRREPVTQAQALRVLIICAQILLVMVVGLIAEAISGSKSAAGFVFILGALWIIFGRRIRNKFFKK